MMKSHPEAKKCFLYCCRRIGIDSEQLVTPLPATADTSKDLEVKVEGLQGELSSLRSAVGDGFEKVFKLKPFKRFSGGAPTVPWILLKSNTVKVKKEVSFKSIPKGVPDEWSKVTGRLTRHCM